METIALMSTLKKPFSLTSTLYDEENGNKPFIVPIFETENDIDVIKVAKHGIEISSEFKRLHEETQWILYILAFFKYAAKSQYVNICDAYAKSFGEEITFEIMQAFISQAVLYHVNNKDAITIDGKSMCIDLFTYDETDFVCDELWSLGISNDLMKQLKQIKCFGPSISYKKASEILEMKFKEISFFTDLMPLPSTIITI